MATMTRGFNAMGDRYDFDFKLCSLAKGWAQIDTRQDAPYYGNWANPGTRELVSYAEGDITHTQCVSDADFITTLRECIEWHREREYFLGLDAGSGDVADAFKRLGFEAELH